MEKRKNSTYKDAASFRDPSGFVFYQDGFVYRKINKCYFDNYNLLMDSGLYKELVEKKLLIPHHEIEKTDNYIIIEAEKIPFISYPYEWCFEEFKDAALLTLEIEEIALKYGMTLKDASGYNIAFHNGRAIFIDTLSFDKYEEGSPWGGYGQFTRHFFAPLVLMSTVNEGLNCMLKDYIDGIPLDIACDILKNRGGLLAWQHIKLQNKAINKHNNDHSVKKIKMPKNGLNNMIFMLKNGISKLKRKNVKSEWGDYYDNTNYDALADDSKVTIVSKLLDLIKFEKDDITFDLGANDGKYSKLAADKGSYTIAFDKDNVAVNNDYINCKEKNITNILPLILDLTNPSPSLGFASTERKCINERSEAKCLMALALIHHIAISNNVPLDKIANWFSRLSEYLIIEFVPKNDSQVIKLLETRRDIFTDYTQDNCEKSFLKYYDIIQKENVKNSERIIYLMRNKQYE